MAQSCDTQPRPHSGALETPVSDTAYLCFGKDCRKRSSDIEKLEAVLEEAGFACERVGCQKICSGPVVGLTVEGTLEWFEKVRGKAGREALRRFIERGDGPLRKRRKPKRSGRLRRKKKKHLGEA